MEVPKVKWRQEGANACNALKMTCGLSCVCQLKVKLQRFGPVAVREIVTDCHLKKRLLQLGVRMKTRHD